MNMPKDTIQRAINKADRDNSSFLELSFEGKLPHGVLVFVDSLTDNRNRTVSNVRSIFNKRGGELGTNGSLSYMFDRKGIISLAKGELDPDEFELELIDAGIEEIELEDDTFMITTPMEDFHNVQLKLQALGVDAESAELQRIPNDTLDLTLEQGVQIMKIIEEFEDDDDVQSVYHNVNVSDELAEAME
jgi:YebC/PmpR family DNA-binding regulatory protein